MTCECEYVCVCVCSRGQRWKSCPSRVWRAEYAKPVTQTAERDGPPSLEVSRLTQTKSRSKSQTTLVIISARRERGASVKISFTEKAVCFS